MAIYIDSFNASYRGMTMCHMVADTTEELLHMADQIGVNRRWIQDVGTPREHFDICLSKKKKALALGAKQITLHEMGEFLKQRYTAEKEVKNNGK